MSVAFLGVGLALTILGAGPNDLTPPGPLPEAGRGRGALAPPRFGEGLEEGSLCAFGMTRQSGSAACVLVLFGIGVYLPIPAISGRYTMPAVWGLDLASRGCWECCSRSR